MDVNFEYYKIFYYVAKYHNFTKAAQALNNSQQKRSWQTAPDYPMEV